MVGNRPARATRSLDRLGTSEMKEHVAKLMPRYETETPRDATPAGAYAYTQRAPCAPAGLRNSQQVSSLDLNSEGKATGVEVIIVKMLEGLRKRRA